MRRVGQTTLRECIHCGHIQRCIENIISRENETYIQFLDKLTRSPNVGLDDAHKALWLRDLLTREGYVPEGQMGEFRRLQRRYDTQIR